MKRNHSPRLRFLASLVLGMFIDSYPFNGAFAGLVGGTSDASDGCGNGTGGSGGGSGGHGSSGSQDPVTKPGCNSCNSGGTGGSGGGTGGNGGSCECSEGMARWEVSEPHINVWLYDEPLGYQPGLGPKISFKLAYKQREVRFLYDGVAGNYTGVGPGWHSSWVSYLYRNYTIETNVESIYVCDPPESENCAWVEITSYTTNYDGTATVVMADGGQRTFLAGGTAPEYYSRGTLTRTVNGDGSWATATINYPDGSKEEYATVTTSPVQVGPTEILYRTAKYDRFGNATRFYYYSNYPLLHYVVDTDSRTNTLSYTGTLITSVQDPFGRTATLTYDHDGWLTNITDVQGMSSSFKYNAVGWVTNLHTPYGNTTFAYANNGFAVDSGTCTRSAIRSVKVTDAVGGTHVYALFQESHHGTYGELPAPLGVDTPTLSTLYDASPHYRSSFYWGPRHSPLLPSDLCDVTLYDLLRARLKHWLHDNVEYTPGVLDYTYGGGLSQTLAMEIAPSPDEVVAGLITLYNYDGKQFGSNPTLWVGTNSQPSLVTRVALDGTTWYTWYHRDHLGRATNVVDTYSTEHGETAQMRTNVYVYSGLDLIAHYGPDGNLEDGYGYNAKHQLIYYTNAVGDVTTNGYDTVGRLTTTRSAAGLNTTNIYHASGWYTNFLDKVIDLEIQRTNFYTWANDLVHTHTDERGLITTNIYDNLQRATNVLDSRGKITYLYDKLDLVQVIDRMNHTNSYSYDNVRRKTSQTDALGRTTFFDYCTCGALNYVQDALGNQTKYFYDVAGRMTNVVYPDGYSVTNTYDLLGRISYTTDSAGISETNWYVNQGLLYTTWNAAGSLKFLTFDNHDHVTNSVDANGVTITNNYDAIGRLRTRGYPDGGVEKFGYTARGLVAYTNQLGLTNFYVYDEGRRKIFETNANWELICYTNNPAGDLLALVDGKNQVTKWNYDQYGRVTNKVDQANTEILRYQYDPDDRLTNRWSAAKGNTGYAYDPVHNLTNINYPVSPDIALTYDPLNRVTNMVDAVGTTKYAYTAGSQLWTEDGPWSNDTVTNLYSHRLRGYLSLQQPAGTWANSFGYDMARRLTNVTSQAGSFGYLLADFVPSTLTIRLDLPNTSYITNTYDVNARLLSTTLKNSSHTTLNSHTYGYNPGNQRTQQVFNVGSTYNYTYDKIGQLKVADSATASEDRGYTYDPAWNLTNRTVNTTPQTFQVDVKNQLTTSTPSGACTYDANGNLISSVGGALEYAYDDENQLSIVQTNTVVYSTNYPLWQTLYAYDGIGRLRLRVERDRPVPPPPGGGEEEALVFGEESLVESGGGITWYTNNITEYIYDGWRVIQERDGSNVPKVSYTRGTDLSGSLEGAGGIGGLLARSHSYASTNGSWYTHNCYHADGNGNVTYIVNSSQTRSASYRHDPYGNAISASELSGLGGIPNTYRFSSKMVDLKHGLYYYGYRWYEPNLQRWLNRDPINERDDINLFRCVRNNPINKFDPYGLLCGSGITDILVPDSVPGVFDFTDCCRAHDECYGNVGADRGECDDAFRECMLESCEDSSMSGCCEAFAEIYYAVTDWLGESAFDRAQRFPFTPLRPNTLPPGGLLGAQ